MAGGLLDQPAGLMTKLDAIERVKDAYIARKERKQGKWAEWEKKYPGAMEIVRWVEGLRDGK